jgi:hypothetical protein
MSSSFVLLNPQFQNRAARDGSAQSRQKMPATISRLDRLCHRRKADLILPLSSVHFFRDLLFSVPVVLNSRIAVRSPAHRSWFRMRIKIFSLRCCRTRLSQKERGNKNGVLHESQNSAPGRHLLERKHSRSRSPVEFRNRLDELTRREHRRSVDDESFHRDHSARHNQSDCGRHAAAGFLDRDGNKPDYTAAEPICDDALPRSRHWPGAAAIEPRRLDKFDHGFERIEHRQSNDWHRLIRCAAANGSGDRGAAQLLKYISRLRTKPRLNAKRGLVLL